MDTQLTPDSVHYWDNVNTYTNTGLWTHNSHLVLREMQTLHVGCSKVEPKKFTPSQNPYPGGMGWPKFNQLEMVTTFSYKPSLVRIDARNFELSW